ncbi:MAG: hypothetical protein GX224_06560 [Thermoplasmatales archaeon]|nr:hypothetical protein [Thermoplasmatales archaeon]
MEMKTVAGINEKIKAGKAVVVTAEEMVDIVRSKGAEKAAEKVDVVTTGTFSAMCSSGAFLNFGHSDPPIRMTNILINDVQAYGGLAAVDTYIGAAQLTDKPDGGYGGGHVIEDLVAGKSVALRAWGPGTDCYVRRSIDTRFTLDDINEAYLYNPRNCYQNYSVATNGSDRTLHTYMGKLLPRMRNATFSSAGQLSPLLNDPHLATIGVGTRIFLGGGVGYVAWNGTQFSTAAAERNGVPVSGARTLALIGDLKGMSRDFLRGLDFHRYGTSLAVGVGIPIPVLDAGVAARAGISDGEIYANMTDYSLTERDKPTLAQYSYEELRSGSVEYDGHTIRTSSMSSYKKARDVANTLKGWIEAKEFLLSEPVQPLPAENRLGTLEVR